MWFYSRKAILRIIGIEIIVDDNENVTTASEMEQETDMIVHSNDVHSSSETNQNVDFNSRVAEFQNLTRLTGTLYPMKSVKCLVEHMRHMTSQHVSYFTSLSSVCLL